MTKRTVLTFLIGLLVTALCGCGGGGRGVNAPTSLGNGPASASGDGRATFTIRWPVRSRLIPLASNSIAVVVRQGTTQIAQQVLPRPAVGGTSTVTFDRLPIGILTVSATAYPNTDGSGVAQATATIPLLIRSNQITAFSLTMASTIDHLEGPASPPSIELARRLQLPVIAKDAAGNVVLTTPGTLTWTSSDSTVAAVDANGIVSALATGSARINVTETESGKQVSVGVSVTPAVGLVSWWRGEGNGADSIGGNTGTPFGNVGYTPGIIGQAFQFDGASGTISIPDADNLKITGSITVDARVYVNAFPSQQQNLAMILFRGDQRAGYDPYFLCVTYYGTIPWAIQNNDPGQISVVQPFIPLHEWVHVTATLDDATGVQSVYFNGVLMDQTTTTLRPLRDLDPNQLPGVAIGNSSGYPQGGFNYTFNGYIDEVKVYNRVVAPGL